MIVYSFFIIIGLIGLIWSADKFIDSSATIASRLNVPRIVIGMLVIGFGTSAPEVVVSSLSAIQHQARLAFGNAYGSNIANIFLVLGVTATLGTIAIHPSLKSKEIPFLVTITIITLAILYAGYFSRMDAILLMALFGLFLFWVLRKRPYTPATVEQKNHNQSHFLVLLLITIISLVVLLVSSQLLITGAVGIATYFGVSSLIIGLTIVAIGTSLPELAASISAMRKGEYGLILGNIIGSNIFNTLLVAGIAGAIQPTVLPSEMFYRDGIVMLIATLILLGMCCYGRISRISGILLILGYALYLGWLLF